MMPSFDSHGWTLVSAEERHRQYPDTFEIPPREARERVVRGQAVQLLFDIATREDGLVVDRGVDRMWVVVERGTPSGYVGILDSDPGVADGLRLRVGDRIAFGPEHIARIENPPRGYLIQRFGRDFVP